MKPVYLLQFKHHSVCILIAGRLLTESHVSLTESNQVFRSTQIPVITGPKGDDSQFHESQLYISDITKNKWVFFSLKPGPTQILLLFKQRFVLKIDLTETDPPKYD